MDGLVQILAQALHSSRQGSFFSKPCFHHQKIGVELVACHINKGMQVARHTMGSSHPHLHLFMTASFQLQLMVLSE